MFVDQFFIESQDVLTLVVVDEIKVLNKEK